jgi:hypothetical protein
VNIAFKFGDMNFWIDKISEISQVEVWLEILTNNIDQAAEHLQAQEGGPQGRNRTLVWRWQWPLDK